MQDAGETRDSQGFRIHIDTVPTEASLLRPFLRRRGAIAAFRDYLCSKPQARFRLVVFSMFCAGVSAVGVVLTPILVRTGVDASVRLLFVAALASSLFALSVALLAYVPRNDIDAELAPIFQRRAEINERLERSQTVFDTAQLTLNQLAEYYAINKNQAIQSFRFSFAAILVGLLLIAMGIWLFYMRNLDGGLAAISGIAGLLVQFIGGANFYIYNKSLGQLNLFYDRLVRTQDTMLAIKLCDLISDTRTQDSVRQQLVLQLIARGGTTQFEKATESRDPATPTGEH